MTIPLTVVAPDGAVDLVLPAQVPVAVLHNELAALVGHVPARLSTPGGRVLDPARGLAENGVGGGALLLLTPAATEPVVDDLADAVAPGADAAGTGDVRATGPGGERAAPNAAPGPAAPLSARWAGLTLTAAWLGHAGTALRPAAVAAAVLVVLGARAVLPRLVLRLYRLQPGTDPAGPGVLARVQAARTATARLDAGLAVCALGGGTALASGGAAGAVAGGLLLLAVALRTGSRDPAVGATTLTALALAAFTASGPGQPILAALGPVVVGALLTGPASPPALQVLRQRGERFVAVTLPATLLLAGGMLPVPPW